MNKIRRLLNLLRIKNDNLICIRQANTYVWGPELGEITPGRCTECNEPIFYEKQNWVIRNKTCHICHFSKKS